MRSRSKRPASPCRRQRLVDSAARSDRDQNGDLLWHDTEQVSQLAVGSQANLSMIQLLAIRQAIDERRLASPIRPSNPSSSPANRFNDNRRQCLHLSVRDIRFSIVKTAVLLRDFLLATGSMIAHSVDLFEKQGRVLI